MGHEKPGAPRGSLGLGGGAGPRKCRPSIFSTFQVSHEFAINFNPTNPFCSGECQAHLYLPWVERGGV